MTLDERRIQEIVERVVARLGTGLPATPAEAVERAALRAPAPARPSPKRDLRVPRGTSGIFSDVDAAVKAAREAFEQHERASLEQRERVVAAMRAVTLQHVRELAHHSVDETGLGRLAVGTGGVDDPEQRSSVGDRHADR